MKKVLMTALFCLLSSGASAQGVTSYGNVEINPDAYGVQTFKCHGKTFYSDISLPNIHGCDVDITSYGPKGKRSDIVTVHYDWIEGDNGAQKPRKAVFYRLPDGQMYRLTDTIFLESPLLTAAFEDMLSPIPGSLGVASNINLERFSERNIDQYGGVFCVNYFMKHPFGGQMGWCQGDKVVGSDAYYLKGAMSFGDAAIRAQNTAYEKKLRLKGRLLGGKTMTAFNVDQNGWSYYAFAVPGIRDNEDNAETYYIFRVYFNGYTEIHEKFEMPSSPEDL